MITPQIAVERLNSMFEADSKALTDMVNREFNCNKTLANHPTCQVGKNGEQYYVRLLGVINGIFGCNDNSCGYIAAIVNDKDYSEVQGFQVVNL